MHRPSPDNDAIAAEIAHLRGLDLAGLRAHWRSTSGRTAPAHLPKHLLFRILAYRLQADRVGDLDKETLRLLDQAAKNACGDDAKPSRDRDLAHPRTGLCGPGPS